MDRDELEGLDRESLVVRAEEAGIRRARILTRPELIDELLRRDANVDEAELRRARGFFGRAKDLLSRVVERGLHLPDAASRMRFSGTLPAAVPMVEAQAMPTLTLAEIYAAQGHKSRAVETLRKVLEREPEHGAARALLARLEDAAYVAPAPPLPPEPEIEPPDPRFEPEPESEDPPPQSGEVAAVSQESVIGHTHTRAEIEDEGSLDADDVLTSSEVTISECVALPLGGGATYVFWRLGLDHRAAASSDSNLVVRAVAVTPSWDGPSTEVFDIDVAANGGEVVLEDLPESAVVRVAVGVEEEGVFVPYAQSPAFERGSADLGEPDAFVEWSTRGSAPVTVTEGFALALRGARRATASARL